MLTIQLRNVHQLDYYYLHDIALIIYTIKLQNLHSLHHTTNKYSDNKGTNTFLVSSSTNYGVIHN